MSNTLRRGRVAGAAVGGRRFRRGMGQAVTMAPFQRAVKGGEKMYRVGGSTGVFGLS